MQTSFWRAALAGACLMASANVAHSAEMKWAKSFNAAMAQAKTSNKLVMVDFYTDW